MFVPLIVGTLAAIVAGVLVDMKHAFFYNVVPIIGGGIGEGILPLSIGYGEVLGKASESFVGQLIPAGCH